MAGALAQLTHLALRAHALRCAHCCAGKDIALVLAGNKVDMERSRQVPAEEAEAYAASIGAALFGTSAKLNRGVEQAFLAIAKSACVRAVARARVPRTPADAAVFARCRAGGAEQKRTAVERRARHSVIPATSGNRCVAGRKRRPAKTASSERLLLMWIVLVTINTCALNALFVVPSVIARAVTSSLVASPPRSAGCGEPAGCWTSPGPGAPGCAAPAAPRTELASAEAAPWPGARRGNRRQARGSRDWRRHAGRAANGRTSSSVFFM